MKFLAILSEPWFIRTFLLASCLGIALSTCYQMFSQYQEVKPTVALAKGSDYQGPSSVKIAVARPLSLDGMSFEQLETLRASRFQEHPELLLGGSYSITPYLFKDADLTKPWLAIESFYLSKRPAREIPTFPGSLASRIIVNPYLLVKAEFWGLSIWGPNPILWKPESEWPRVSENELLSLAPREEQLVYKPGASSASVTYQVTKFVEQVQPLLQKDVKVSGLVSLSFQNAFDLGYRFFKIDPSSILGFVWKGGKEDEFVPIVDRFISQNFEWLEGMTFNHQSRPEFEESLFELQSLPGFISITLYQQAEEGIKGDAFTFNILAQ